jgi:hypothetical protein
MYCAKLLHESHELLELHLERQVVQLDPDSSLGDHFLRLRLRISMRYRLHSLLVNHLNRESSSEVLQIAQLSHS